MDNNITHNADSLKSIVEATGGFQWLLEQFILKVSFLIVIKG